MVTTPEPSVLQRLPSLTGLRIIAAGLVFAVHGSIFGLFRDPEIDADYMTGASTAGYVGIVFFFVLSGFVLTWTAREESPRRFWRRRVFKIFPNHLVAFVLAIGVLVWAGRSTDPVRVVTNLLLIQGWFPSETIITDTVSVITWSLSAELFFYALFPLIFRLVRRIPESRLALSAVAAVAGIFLIPVIAGTVFPDQPDIGFGTVTFTQIWFVYFFPVTRLLEFVLGTLLARMVLAGRWVGPGVLISSIIAVGAYVLSLQLPMLFQFVAVSVIPIALLIAAAARVDARGGRTVFGTRPMVWLGEVSYAFFLLHFLMLSSLRLLLDGERNEYGGIGGPAYSTLGGITFLIASFALSVLASWALYRTVERPVMRAWARPRTGQRPPADLMKAE